MNVLVKTTFKAHFNSKALKVMNICRMESTEQYNRVIKKMKQYYDDAPAPTLKGWKTWIENLDEPMKSGFKARGFEGSKKALPFIRFNAELKDYGMRDYMRDALSEEDFVYYKNTIE